MEQEKESKAEPVKFPGTVRRILPLFPSAWLIPIAIVAVLVAIILPMFQKAKVHYKYEVCRDNLAEIAIGVLVYSSETTSLPSPDKWNDLIFEKVGEQLYEYQCPLIEQTSKICPYVMNRNLSSIGGPVPDDMVMLFEGPVGWNQTGGSEMMVFRHKDYKNDTVCNVALANGKVMTVDKNQAQNLKWKP
ncbi:MAG: hypothetical protein K9M75_06535 [Phycisphaerae bacterium]|nr:hypothetical protein [Phycisphaerae bacterium]